MNKDRIFSMLSSQDDEMQMLGIRLILQQEWPINFELFEPVGYCNVQRIMVGMQMCNKFNYKMYVNSETHLAIMFLHQEAWVAPIRTLETQVSIFDQYEKISI